MNEPTKPSENADQTEKQQIHDQTESRTTTGCKDRVDDTPPPISSVDSIPIIPPGFKEWSSPPKPPSSKSLSERIAEARKKIAAGVGIPLKPDFKGPTAIIWTIHDQIAICPIDENEGAELPEFPWPANPPAGGDCWKWHPDVRLVERYTSAQKVSEVSGTVGQQQEDQEP